MNAETRVLSYHAAHATHALLEEILAARLREDGARAFKGRTIDRAVRELAIRELGEARARKIIRAAMKAR